MHFFSRRKQGSSSTNRGADDTASVGSAADRLAGDLARTDSSTLEDTPCGLKELVAQSEDDVHCVDIVAIHGLNGHREKTWTDSTARINWLSDERCLPKDIPNARVLTYGYNSRTTFSRSTSDVRDVSSELLAAVKASRKSPAERRRPIAFVCHSLGGLVFKQLVVRAHEQYDHYASVLESIRAVTFFATPHRGSDLAFWNNVGATLVHIGTFGYLANTKLSKNLMVDGELLKHISESFTPRGGQFKITSFYETLRMKGLNCEVVGKESAILGWPNEVDIAASAHHSGICKFSSPSDPRYLTAISAIIDMIGDVGTEDETAFGRQEEACMRGLNSAYDDHLGQVDDPVPGTCQWILSHEKWHRWESLRGSGLLWITADAGCGKSVIAKFLVNHLLSQKASSRKHVCHFFFKDGVEDQNDGSAAVSGILHQLCYSQRRLIRHVVGKYTSMSERMFGKLSSLWTILMAIISDKETRDIIWILDGLDECEKKSLTELIKMLAACLDSRLSTGRSQCSFKVIILSRPHNIIQQRLRLSRKEDYEDVGYLPQPEYQNKLRLVAEEESKAIAKDIALFVRYKLVEFGENTAFVPSTIQRLEDRLLGGADYTFLWISLVIKLVEDSEVDGISIAQLEAILNTTDLGDIYERLLSGRELPVKARKALMLVLAAVRPLSIEEMCVAIEIRQDHFPSASDDIQSRTRLYQYQKAELRRGAAGTELKTESEDSSSRAELMFKATISSLQDLGNILHRPYSNHLRQICGHFLRVRNRKVYLVHQTAREFLLETNAFKMHREFPFQRSQPGGVLSYRAQSYNEVSETTAGQAGAQRPWGKSISLDQANRYLLEICADYIELIHYGTMTNETTMEDIHWTTARVIAYLKDCRGDPPRAFFKYAAFHWVDHYRPVRRMLDFSFDYLLRPSGELFKTWIMVHETWIPEYERMRLEAGGIAIDEHASYEDTDKDEEKRFNPLSTNAFYSPLKSANKKARGLEDVLEEFNLTLGEETELYDEEFLAGDRYWKHDNDQRMAPVGDDERDDDDDNADDGVDAWQIPHRVRFYERENRKKILEAFDELSNPLSPGGGNPASLFSGDRLF